MTTDLARRGVAATAAARPDALAVVTGEQRTTYGELHTRAARLAHALHRLGAGPGERVAVMLPNSTDYVVAGTATAYAQTPFIPVNWHLKSDELGWILADSGARVLLAHASLAPYVAPATRLAPRCRVVLTGGDAAAVPGAVGLDELLAGADAAEPPAGAWRSPQWMFYTSGTTGRPKGVVHATSAMTSAARDEVMALALDGLCALWGFTAADVHLLAGPGYHAAPGGYAFTTLYAGGTVVVQPAWDPREWYRLVAEHAVTTAFLSPAHLIRLLEVPAAERADTASLRLLIHAGAPCPPGVKRAVIEALPGTEVSEFYGGSEGGVSRITAAEWLARPGSVGRPWPGVEVRILDEQGRALPAGADGLVYVRPPGGVRFAYHGDDGKTAQAWRDDAFTIGDIGHLDADGYLYLTDRASDLVLWGGVNIYPREIEDALHRHPAVVDCAVLGVPDERYGERLAAVVELRGPVPVTALQEHLRGLLADFKVPGTVVTVDALPRDPNGKVRKRVLRDWIVAGCPPSGIATGALP